MQTEDIGVLLERMGKRADRLQTELAREWRRDRAKNLKVELDTIVAAIEDLRRRVSEEAAKCRR
jgi:hypothetical protein